MLSSVMLANVATYFYWCNWLVALTLQPVFPHWCNWLEALLDCSAYAVIVAISSMNFDKFSIALLLMQASFYLGRSLHDTSFI